MATTARTRIVIALMILGTNVLAGADVLDLGDIASGGNGNGTGQFGLGILADSGRAVAPNLFGGAHSGGAIFTRTDGTNGTANLPYVDGVFRPVQTTQISSTGLTFAFPNTGGTNWDAIRNGRGIVDQDSVPWPIRLNDHPGINRPGVGMHVNSGITYDLNKLRQDGFSFDAVSAVAGLNYTYFGDAGASIETWVLIDGSQRYHQVFTPATLMFEAFSIPIGAGDHFLTLATTDHDLRPTDDHAVFADAVLVPEPAGLWLLAASLLLLRIR